MNAVFIGPRRRYHSTHSGYESLARYLTGREAAPAPSSLSEATETLARTLPTGTRRRLLDLLGWKGRWYGRERALAEIRLLPTLMLSRGVVVHHLYGEESYRFGGWAPRLRGSRIVATFHQPPAGLEEHVSRTGIGRLDAIVALTRDQADTLRSLGGGDRVSVIPHGVDTAFFTPGESLGGSNAIRCVFVGYWLRDFDLLRHAIEGLAPDGILFDLVLTPGKAREFRGLPGVVVHEGLTDDDLRQLYRRASLAFLPLLDSTANNAILEAMSCGLPLISTSVGGVSEYCDDSMSILTPPGDVAAVVEAVRALARAPERRCGMARAARTRALERYSWPVVAGEMRALYARLIGMEARPE